MTVNTASVQTDGVVFKAAPTLPFIVPMAKAVGQGLSLVNEYCCERRLLENIVESVVAATVVAATVAVVFCSVRFLLIALAVVWFLAVLGFAGYRLMGLARNREELEVEPIAIYGEDLDTFDVYTMKLADSMP